MKPEVATNESKGQAVNSEFDLQQLQQLGHDVTEAMKTLRELLNARADALEACRIALVEHYATLDQERASFDEKRNELCESMEQREAQIREQEAESRKLKEEAGLSGGNPTVRRWQS